MKSAIRSVGPALAWAFASGLLVAGLSGYVARATGVDAVRDQSLTVARLLAVRLESPVLRHRSKDAESVLSECASMDRLTAARVTGADGQLLARWSRGPEAEAPAAPDVRVTQPILVSRRPIGTLTLEVDLAGAGPTFAQVAYPACVSFLSVFLALLWQRRTAGARSVGQRARGLDESSSGSEAPPSPVDRATAGDGPVEQSVATLREQLATQARELDEARRALDALTEAKSRFLANMSHEIRTPLNGVLGMTELLLNTTMDGRQQRFAQTVRRSAESLLNIVNDILDFSRMESGKLHLEHLDFDMVELVEDVVHLHAEGAHSKGLELLCQMANELPRAAKGDPGRLRQVLTNLLSNAIKFTSEGEIVVRIDGTDHPSGKTAYVLEVSDTGIGMTSEVRSRVFASFFQADASTTRRYDGAGLGLAISHHLVELMGGSIDVESEPGRGSRFTVEVCIERGRANLAERARPDIQGVRVLAVDDNETNRRILAEQLASWHVDGDECADGPAALEALRVAARSERAFDIAILDMQMPEMDGIELARAIKADPEIRDVRIMLLTSATLDADARELEEAGIDQFTSKPARQSQLYDCLANLMAARDGDRRADAAPADASKARSSSIQGRVLLVEDNEVNQEVARSMLEDLGCEVHVVDNGQEALAASASGTFDIILMDCQMPVMDGFETTMAMKEGSSKSSESLRAPIIALTANALAGDRERCLAAGMDDYISKPFKQEELRAVLEHWLGRELCADDPVQEHRDPAGVEDAPSIVLDERALDALRRLQRPGRPDVLGKVARLYRERSPTLVEAMQAALESKEPAALQAAAHTLKSASANLGADDMVAVCKQLEELGRSCKLDGAAELLQELETLFACTVIELGRLETSDTRAAG